MQIKYIEMNVIRGVGYQLINLPKKILSALQRLVNVIL